MENEKNNKFQKLIDLWSLIIEEKKCFWTNEQDILSILPCLAAEIRELQEAIKTCNYEEIISELGDIVGLALLLCFLAERDGICSISTIVSDHYEKVKRRAAYIFDPLLAAQITTKQEASQLWENTKKLEKKQLTSRPCKEDIIECLRGILEKNDKEISCQEK